MNARFVAILTLTIVVLVGFTAAPVSAQSSSGASGISAVLAPVSAPRPGVVVSSPDAPEKEKDFSSGAVTISGYVLDENGNPLPGLGWPSVNLELWQEFQLGRGKTTSYLVAETSCDRNGWGNGCPDQNGWYAFSYSSWGGDLYPGRYQVCATATGFGAKCSETFWADGRGSQDFSLVRLEAYTWVNDPSRIEVSGDNVMIPLTTYGSDEQDVDVLFDVSATAQSETNDSEKELALSPKGKLAPVTLVRALQSNWRVRRTFPGLSGITPGTRVCLDVVLRHAGYPDWVAGRLSEPVCVTKGFTTGSIGGGPIVMGDQK